MNSVSFENASDFERVVLLLLRRDGYTCELAPRNAPGYDIEISNGRERVAVQVKNHKARVAVPALEKFMAFLASEAGAGFSRGILVSASGFAKTVSARLTTADTNSVSLAQIVDGKFAIDEHNRPQPESRPAISEHTYIGVFTAKGGVGKTTVAAHLAGAFALSGYNVVLVDLDPQGNLRKLLGDGVYVPPPKGKGEGTEVTVLNHDEWIGDEQNYSQVKVVICDCNPDFHRNSEEYIRRFDYCIVPTTLNPLGINKHGDVVHRTFKEIRSLNSDAELFVVINNFHSGRDYMKRNKELSGLAERAIEKIGKELKKCYYINPLDSDDCDGVAIRHSRQLAYWGHEHLIHNKFPQLAFTHIAGRCHPREDFLRLADYFEQRTEIRTISS